MEKNRFIEICANSATSCVEAEAGGARRVELRAGIPEGGTTPGYGEIRTAQELTSTLAIHILVRPRRGNFLYTPAEINPMLNDIRMAHNLGLQGIAIGCLTRQGEIDLALLDKFMEAAGSMSVTFHRAFDLCRDPFRAMEHLIDAGCHRILTSGQQPDAEKGLPLIAELVKQAAGRITIMPGGGVRAHNIARIEAETGATEFHTSARILLPDKMQFHREEVPMGSYGMKNGEWRQTCQQEVRKMVSGE